MRSRGWALLLLVAAGCSRFGAGRAGAAEELLPPHPAGAVVTAPLGALAQHVAALTGKVASLPGGEQVSELHRGLTAQLGLIRNLTGGEIVAQVLLPLEEHKAQLAPQTNIVLMGQGEPLLNFEPVMAAVGILLDPGGMGISPKHVTLSTSGIVPGIERLAQEKVRPKLAISLNASNDEQRDALMPINKKYPLSVLMEACKNYPLRTWEHLTFEYVMLGGLNDAAEDARRVVRLLAPLKSVKVNLIPWNPGELPYRESSSERIEEFRRILVERGVPAFVRYSRGRDIMAACGQLALLQVQSSPLTTLRSSVS